MNARILLNPAAGRGRGARRRAALEKLARRHALPLLVSAGPDDLVALARRCAAEGCERLLVAGGDGTYHHAAQGLAGTDCALVPVALGTGNDLARELGLPLDAGRAVELGLEAPLERMDLGRAGERYFCGVAGSGLDSEVAEYSRAIRRLRGPLVYVWAVLVVLARFAPPDMRLEIDGERLDGRVMLAAFANTRFFGGGMKIAPGAERSDGRLDVVVVRELSRAGFLAIFPRVYRGTHTGHPRCRVVRAARCRVAFDREMSCWGDGERLAPVGPEGLLIDLVPGALRVPRVGLASRSDRDRNVTLFKGAGT
jgi:diacylglycerol kinase (ATP)